MMKPQFIAKPPQAVKWRALPQHLTLTFRRLGRILWQIVVPFNYRPEEIDQFPEPHPALKVTEQHVKQCQWIFDQAEARRVQLEQKAQSTFALMVFLVPLIASLFVFILSRASASGVLPYMLISAGISVIFLLLAFIAAIRAVGVKETQSLFLSSVIHEGGQFRQYNEAFHAYGLIYCASMNTAMNDHIAQFVKGAHILTAAALLGLLTTSVPAAVTLVHSPAAPAQTAVVGTVAVSSPELAAILTETANLRRDLQKLSRSGVSDDDFRRLEEKVTNLAKMYEDLKKSIQPAENTKTPRRGGASK